MRAPIPTPWLKQSVGFIIPMYLDIKFIYFPFFSALLNHPAIFYILDSDLATKDTVATNSSHPLHSISKKSA